MSLYDGLDVEDKGGFTVKAKADVAGWGSSIKILQTQKNLQEKSKPNLLQPRKRGATLAPVIDLKRSADEEDGEVYFNMLTGKMERRQPLRTREPSPPASVPRGEALSHSDGSSTLSHFIGMEPSVNITDVADEYDPLYPNEYEEFSKRRREEKREEERKKEQAKKAGRQQEEKEKRELVSHYDSESDSSDDESSRRDARKDDRKGGAAIAPPSSLLENVVKADDNADEKVKPGYGPGSVASKIMAKMGYRQGQGLGKKEQGMSTALQVEKTSKRGGKIIHEKDVSKESMTPPEQAEPGLSITKLMKNPTKVILLMNMVERDEVDDELEAETGEECTKYGKVNRCVIHEMPPEYGLGESVRIFVEFERMESAIKAVVDMNGRFFGGRTVSAYFYNFDRFRRMELEYELPT